MGRGGSESGDAYFAASQAVFDELESTSGTANYAWKQWLKSIDTKRHALLESKQIAGVLSEEETAELAEMNAGFPGWEAINREYSEAMRPHDHLLHAALVAEEPEQS